MVTLYAQVSYSFITSQIYQKWSGDVILDNSGKHCSVYKWQDKAEHELIKTTLISSVSHLNLGVEAFFEELTQKNICMIQIIAYSG